MLGIVENMCGFVCPKCHLPSDVLPATSGGGAKLATNSDVPLLGKVPLDPLVGRSCDQGEDIFDSAATEDVTTSPVVKEYQKIVNKLKQMLTVE